VSTTSSIRRRVSGPIARGAVRTSGVLAARLLVQAATLLILARQLGPAQFGALAALLAWAMFLGTLATFGTHLVVARDLARDAEKRDSLLPVVLGTTAFCGFVLLFVYLLTAIALRHELSTGWLTVVCIGVAELIVQPLLMIASMERLAAGQVARSQLLKMLPLPLQLAAATCLWLFSWSSPLLVYAGGHLTSTLIAITVGLALLERPWPKPQEWRLLNQRGWKDNSGFALLALTASGPTELDKVLAARLLPLEMAGIYSAASRMMGALVVPVSSLMISALPRLFRESGNGLPQPALLRWIFGGSLAYGVTAAAALWLLSPVVQLLFGNGFDELSRVTGWLSLVVPGLCLRQAAASILMTMGNPWARVGIEAAGTALLVASATALVLGGVTQGVVIAVICAETAMAAFSWGWIVARYFGNDHRLRSTPCRSG